jgi:hypothetical protein
VSLFAHRPLPRAVIFWRPMKRELCMAGWPIAQYHERASSRGPSFVTKDVSGAPMADPPWLIKAIGLSMRVVTSAAHGTALASSVGSYESGALLVSSQFPAQSPAVRLPSGNPLIPERTVTQAVRNSGQLSIPFDIITQYKLPLMQRAPHPVGIKPQLSRRCSCLLYPSQIKLFK